MIFYPNRNFIALRAELRAIALMGKPTRHATAQDIRNTHARREIERRRLEKEARQ